MVLGYMANGYNEDCAYNRKTASVENINKVTVATAKFKEFMIRDKCDINVDTPYTDDWDEHMVLHAKFDRPYDPANNPDPTSMNYDSGNYKYNVQNTKHILVKRRPVNGYEWMTVYSKDISDASDFTFSFFDNYAASMTEYEYALVPVKNNGTEGDYTYQYVTSEFDGCYIVDTEKMFRLFVDLKMDRNVNSPRAFITSLNKKYPTTVKTSKAKYMKGSATASVIDFICNDCKLDEENAWKYRNDFLDFLYNGKAKVLKTYDGRFNYIIEIEDGASESASENWNLPTTSFNFVQIGSAESTEDMTKAGLIEVEREWWEDK